MTKNVREILKNYSGENPGVLTNLARLFSAGRLSGTGKLVILPVDQGFEHGPFKSFEKNPPAYDPSYHFELALESGCSAYAAPYGFLKAEASNYAGDLPLILKLNSSDSLYKDPQNPLPALTSSVEEALRLGCVGVGFTIYPGSGMRNAMYEEIAEIASQARSAGLVVVIWSYPRGGTLSKKGETALDVVSYAAQVASQLGAHIVKVKPPTSHFELSKPLETMKTEKLKDRVGYVLKSAFNGKRIVIFSGGEVKSEKELLEEVKELALGGAYGSIVGRNAFQRPKKEAIKLLGQIQDIYKNA